MHRKQISARQLREQQADVLNAIAYGGEHFVVSRHGKEVAAMISVHEFELLQKTVEAMEDAMDIRDALQAMEEAEREGTIPLEEVLEEYGLALPGRDQPARKKAAGRTSKKRRKGSA